MMAAATVSSKENVALLIAVIASLTFLWPLVFLLMLSSTLRKKLYKYNMVYKHEGVDVLSKKLFSILRDSCPQFDFRRLHILDLGARVSFHFAEYSEQHEIDVVCDNMECFDRLEDKPVNVHFYSCSDVLRNCKESSYDVVVSTFFLCSVKNPTTTLNDIRRILKPGGKFMFLEHCGFPENEFSFKFQRLLSPVWRILFQGCRLSHHPSHLLKLSAFHSLNYKTYYNRSRIVFYRPIIVGVCTK